MKKKLKEFIKKNPFLYKVAMSIYTFKLDDIRHLSDKDRFYSKFGGTWVDASNYKETLDKKISSQQITKEEAAIIETWEKKGYVIFENAIPAATIDKLNEELRQLKTNPNTNVKITGNFEGSKPYDQELISKNNSVRIVDFYAFSDAAKDILLNEKISRFLTIIFEKPPLVFQSLNFEYGSQQNIHQDTGYVVANEPMKLAAAWIALEDVKEGSGELIYYEGSHRLPEYLFSQYFKHFDKDRDGVNQHEEWQKLLHENSKKANYPLKKFLPKKGDLLLWHADLAHGGAKITNDNTRRSLVGHYCPSNINPFYFNYLKNRRKANYKSGYYSSSYYEV
jgi:phytanoyl-CoA hydroxylase